MYSIKAWTVTTDDREGRTWNTGEQLLIWSILEILNFWIAQEIQAFDNGVSFWSFWIGLDCYVLFRVNFWIILDRVEEIQTKENKDEKCPGTDR